MVALTRNITEPLRTRAAFDSKTINDAERTVEVVFATERPVTMRSWEIGTFLEVLECTPEAVDFERMRNGAPVLDTHRSYSVKTDGLGVVENAWIQDGKCRAKIRFSKRPDVEPVWQDVKDGVLRNASVGYDVFKYTVEERDGAIPLYRATKWMPTEISMALVGKDPDAGTGRSNPESQTDYKVSIINTQNKNMNRVNEILQLCRAAGLSIEFAQTLIADETLTVEAAKPKIEAERQRAATPAAPPPAPETPKPSNEKERSAGIMQACRAAGLTIQDAEAYQNGNLSLQEIQNDVIQRMAATPSQRTQTMPTGGGVTVGADGAEQFRSHATTGMLLRSTQVPVSEFKAEEISAARAYQGMSLLRVAAACLQRAGVNTSAMSDMEIAAAALTRSISSTSDFPVILENTMNKILLGAYATTPDLWRRFCRVGSVSDFRAHKRIRPGSLANLDAVGENGELKRKPLVDGKAESISAKTKGNIIDVSRNMIINDDLGAFTSLAGDLGRAANRSIEVDVFALLASNPTMGDGVALFHANHGNLAASGAAPSVATFDAMRVAMGKQKDHSNNEILDIKPAILLLGSQNGGDARVINEAQYDPGQNNQKPNKSRGLFRDIVDTARITGNEYYAFADPSVLPVIEVAFLNGVQSPYMQQQESFDQLGVSWRIYMDYGVGAIDWKGAYKNPGA